LIQLQHRAHLAQINTSPHRGRNNAYINCQL
jgi:hypothetical protein